MTGVEPKTLYLLGHENFMIYSLIYDPLRRLILKVFEFEGNCGFPWFKVQEINKKENDEVSKRRRDNVNSTKVKSLTFHIEWISI